MLFFSGRDQSIFSLFSLPTRESHRFARRLIRASSNPNNTGQRSNRSTVGAFQRGGYPVAAVPAKKLLVAVSWGDRRRINSRERRNKRSFFFPSSLACVLTSVLTQRLALSLLSACQSQVISSLVDPRRPGLCVCYNPPLKPGYWVVSKITNKNAQIVSGLSYYLFPPMLPPVSNPAAH